MIHKRKNDTLDLNKKETTQFKKWIKDMNREFNNIDG